MDDYEKVKELGRGAFGTAWLVKHKITEELRAIKILCVVPEANTEVSLFSTLKHSNIVKYYDSFEENNCLHIVMDYCDGGTLQTLMQRKELNEPQVWAYFVQLCSAVKYLHSRSILHRDLKPDNIFLTKQGVVKVGDFGLSKLLEAGMDQTTTTTGCYNYLPPEMCDKKPYSYSCDMWGLGCILYEMAARKPAYSRGAVIMHCDYGKPRPPVDPLSEIWSAELRTLVGGLLELDPDKRLTIDQVLKGSTVGTLAKKLCSESLLAGTSALTLYSLQSTSSSSKPSRVGLRLSEELLQDLFQMHVDSRGRLVNEDGDSYIYHSTPNAEANQERYEAIGQIMELHIHEYLETRLQRIYLCKQNKDKGSFIFASRGYETCKKMLILINGGGVVKAGQWSRRLIINDCLDVGSQIPYIDRALRHKWGVLVMNPNDTYPTVEGCKNPINHGLHVWRTHIAPNKMEKIAIVAHSSGGTITSQILTNFTDDFLRRVYAIAFTDANAVISKANQKYFLAVTRNWVPSPKRVGTELSSKGVKKYSAGTREHSETSHAAINPIFRFIEQRFLETTPAEGS